MVRLFSPLVLAFPILAVCLAIVVLAIVTFKRNVVASTVATGAIASFICLRFILPNLFSTEQFRDLRLLLSSISLATWVAVLWAALNEPVSAAVRKQGLIPKFELKHLMLLTVYTAILAGYFATFTTMRDATEYLKQLRSMPHLLIWGVGSLLATRCINHNRKAMSMLLVGVSLFIFPTLLRPMLIEWRSYTAYGPTYELKEWSEAIERLNAMFISPYAYLLVVSSLFVSKRSGKSCDETVEYVPGEAIPRSC